LAGLRTLREFLEGARLRGAWWAVRILWSRLGFSVRRVYLFHGPIEPPVAPASDDRFHYRFATPADLDRLAVFQPYVLPSRLRQWVENRDTWVLVAFEGDEPAAFYSYSRVPPTRDAVLPPITLGSSQVWVIEVYVRPEYRGRRLSMRIQAHRDRLLHDSGYRETVSRIDDTNHVSLRRTAARLNPSTRIERVTRFRALGFTWHRIERDGRQLFLQQVARFGADRSG
jgi:hypothetical protein